MHKDIKLPEIPGAERTPLVEQLLGPVQELAETVQRQAEEIAQLKDEIAVLKKQKRFCHKRTNRATISGILPRFD